MIKAIINAIIAHNLTFLLIGTSTTSDLPVLHQPNLPRHYTKNASNRCRSSIFTVAR